jgi:hypothetical protein
MRVAKELSPNFTGFPNVLTDRLMAAAGPTRWMLISVIVRKTYGWHTERASISLSTFQDCTGLGRKAVVDRLRQLEAAGLLERTDSTKGTLWELNLECDADEVAARLAAQSGSPIEPLHDGQSGSPIEPLEAASSIPIEPLAGSPIEPLCISQQNRVFKESSKENKNLSPVAQNATGDGDENGGSAKEGAEQKTDPSPEPQPDPRHAPLRAAIQTLQRAAVGADAWDGRCAAALARMLKSRGAGQWPLERLLECAENRFISDVNHAMTPAVWLSQLTDYANGPLDRYGKPVRPDEWAMKAAVGSRRQPEKPRRNFDADLAALQAEMLECGGGVPSPGMQGKFTQKLSECIDKGVWDVWLRPLRVLGRLSDGKTILLAPCEMFDHVRTKYGEQLRAALDGGEFEILIWDETAEGNPWVPI